MTQIKKNVILATLILLVVGGFAGHVYLKRQADAKYWASLNAPETYSGNGFTEKFPCSDVETITDLDDNDLKTTTTSCLYFGGLNHQDIDIHNVRVTRFLSDAYDPATEVNCGSPTAYTGDPKTQVFYRETREVDGFTWILCGIGDGFVSAKLRSGNTVYALESHPHDKKNTSRDLDNLIRNFSLN